MVRRSYQLEGERYMRLGKYAGTLVKVPTIYMQPRRWVNQDGTIRNRVYWYHYRVGRIKVEEIDKDSLKESIERAQKRKTLLKKVEIINKGDHVEWRYKKKSYSLYIYPDGIYVLKRLDTKNKFDRRDINYAFKTLSILNEYGFVEGMRKTKSSKEVRDNEVSEQQEE